MNVVVIHWLPFSHLSVLFGIVLVTVLFSSTFFCYGKVLMGFRLCNDYVCYVIDMNSMNCCVSVLIQFG